MCVCVCVCVCIRKCLCGSKMPNHRASNVNYVCGKSSIITRLGLSKNK